MVWVKTEIWEKTSSEVELHCFEIWASVFSSASNIYEWLKTETSSQAKYYLNQYHIIVNWTLSNQRQWNILIEENEFENVVFTNGGHFVSASMC